MVTLLIKSVRVLGAGKDINESFDVLVNAGKISAIGNFPNKKVDEVIDGQGAYLSPGFIDVDTTSDHYLSLYEDPGQEDFLSQGVTTIIGGQCGASLAPLLAGNLNSLRKWADPNSINVNWHSLKELFFHLDKLPLGVNFGTMVGHSTIRRALTSGTLRDLSTRELETFDHLLETALKDGGFGLSTGLSYLFGRGTPFREVLRLAKIVKAHNGVYSTHLRKNDEELVTSVEETIRIHQESGVKTLITHFVPIKGLEKPYEEALKLIDDLPETSDFHFGIFPLPTTSIPLYTFLPDWARGTLERMHEIISEPSNEERLLGGFKPFVAKDLVVAQALKNDSLVGKNVQELMRIFSLSNSKKTLLKLMRSTKLRAIIHHKNLNTKIIDTAIKNKRSLITSHAPSFGKITKGHLKPDRAISTFPKYLKIAQQDKNLNIEESIKKITLIPAKKFNLHGRGEIKEGNAADLTLFRGDEIKCVIVNGEIAWRNGEATGKLKGKIIRHAAV